MIGDREGSNMLTSVTNRYGFQPHHFRLAHDITLDNGLGSVDAADTSFIFECNKENDFSRRMQQQQQQMTTTTQSCPTDPSNSTNSISDKRHNTVRNSSLQIQILEARNQRNAAKSKLDAAGNEEKGDGEGSERSGGGGSGGGGGRDGDGSPEPAKKHKPDSLSFCGGRTPRIEDLAFGREASRCGLNGVGGRQTTKKELPGIVCRIKPEEPKQQTACNDHYVKGQTFIPVSSNVNCGTQSAAPRSATVSQPLLAQIRQRESATVTNHITRDRPRQLPSPPKPAPKQQQQHLLQPPPSQHHRPRRLQLQQKQQQQQSSRILSLAEELQAAVMSESGSTDCSQLDASLFPLGFLQLDDILRCRGGGISQFLIDVAELGSPDQVDPVNKFRDVVCDLAYGSVVETVSGGEDDGGAIAADRRRRRRTSDADADGRTSSASSTFSRSSSTADSASPGDVEGSAAAATTLGSAAVPVTGCSRLYETESAAVSRSPLRSVSSHQGTSAETTASTHGRSLLGDDEGEDRTTVIATTKSLRGHLDNCSSLQSSRSSSPARRSMLSSPLPTGTGNSLEFDLDEVDATHRGCHRFVPRHPGELAIEIADPIYVELEEDDLWCEGINLRTKQRGIFPTAYATDLSILDDVPRCRKFFLKYLGSIEVSYHRGNDVLCQAINRIVATRKPTLQTCPPPLVCLEINEIGVKMTERTKNKKSILSEETTLAKKLARLLSKDKEPAPAEIDHLFSLKNICFCGYHPKNERYLGIISKHPLAMRFACHVFQSEKSTRTVAEVIGESFQRFYQEYLAAMHPTEDFYLE